MSAAAVIEWCATAEQYRQAVASGAATSGPAESLPILLPADPIRAARWAEVIADRFDGLVNAQPGVRLVVAWGPAASEPARLFADRSGSRLVSVRLLSELLSAITDAPERYIVIVAEAALLTVDAVATSTAALVAAGQCGGLLMGRSAVELSFAVAKALLLARTDNSPIQVFDASSHRQADNLDSLGPDFERQLQAPATTKVLRSHGEGGHAKFPGVIVCGVLDGAEFAEAPELGCGKVPRRCKRAGQLDSATVIFAEELPAAVVAFICCNGFNVAGELYPSPVSMALGFSEGSAGALISPIRPLIAPDSIFDELIAGLRAGTRFGPLVNQLNQRSAELHQPAAFVLHGDPYGSLPPTDPTNLTYEPAGENPYPDEVIRWLTTGLGRAERGRRVLRSARAWMGESAPPELAKITRSFESLELSMLNALKWAESRPAGGSLHGLRRSCGLVRIAMSGWDRSLVNVLLASRETFDAFDVGHYDQAWVAQQPGASCPRCGTPTEIHLFGTVEAIEDQRAAEACLVCGPLAEGRLRGLRLQILDSGTAPDDAGAFLLRARLRVPEGLLVSNVVHLRLRLYDKANGGCVLDEERRLPAEDGELAFRCALPPELGLDLHSARLVAVSGFDLAYARARYARVPLTQ